MQAGRNAPCPCGSGRKYKQCCLKRVALPAANQYFQTTSIPDAIQRAIKLHEAGHLPQAEAIYREILQIRPGHPDVLHLLGVASHQAGDNERAVELIGKAIAINPSAPNYCNNLGRALEVQGKLTEAAGQYRKALLLNPGYVEAHFNLGNTLQTQGRLDEAIESYRRALAFKPDSAEACRSLGFAFRSQGKADEALACFQQQARLAPGNGETEHHIASLSGENTERAPVQYVKSVFDGYAENFDAHLVQALDYDVPEKLAASINRHAAAGAEKWDVLDLGCGTGLVGAAMASSARRLVGVDLSEKMLKMARSRNIYQRLEQEDLLAMMRNEPAASYDVIVAADVFIYLGKLDEIAGEIKRLLRPGGVAAFSIETLPGEGIEPGALRDYQLQISGRYAQSVDYIARLAAANGFLPLEMSATHLRLELGKPVSGSLVLWASAENRTADETASQLPQESRHDRDKEG